MVQLLDKILNIKYKENEQNLNPSFVTNSH